MSTRSLVSSEPGSLSGLSSAASTIGIQSNDVFPSRYRFHHHHQHEGQPLLNDPSSYHDALMMAGAAGASTSEYYDHYDHPPPTCCPLCGYHDSTRQQQYESSVGGGGMQSNLTGEAASAAAIGACFVCIAAIADATAPEERHYQQQDIQESFSESFAAVDNFHDELLPEHENGRFAQYSDAGTGHAGQDITSTTTPTTTVYIGDYNERGQRHGAHGELIWDNGDRYVGSFVNGKRTGSGTLFYRDGSVYTGDWLNNQMHGRGQRTFANGDVYVGSYRHGQRSGGPDCKFKFSNQDLYVGSWESNFFHGPGRYFFADGTALEGHFRHGKKQGKFKRQKPNGTLDILRYENDQVTGQGVRWNATRTKTWLLKTVVDKRQATHHRRMLSDDAVQTTANRRRHHRRSNSSPDVGNDPGDGNQVALASAATTLPSEYDTEPPVEVQVMTMTKKCSRIPIAQAVSIGYDCELGGITRDSNPAFWNIGDFSTNNSNSQGASDLNQSSRNLV